jgi:hypothetical protein
MPRVKLAANLLKKIRLYRGETVAKNKKGPGFIQDKKLKKYRGRWFNPDKNEAKYFAAVGDKSQKGQRILKTVTVSQKDYNIGNKLYKRVFGLAHCKENHCLLPKKELKNVKARKFKIGGVTEYYKGLV